MISVLQRNNVIVSGDGPRTIVFAHGFGCDHGAWRDILPGFAEGFRIVRYDHVGAGGSDLSAYDPTRYASLDAYVQDTLDILAALDLREVVYVGHSVAAMIGMLAAIEQPARFASLVMVCPSPCYIDGPGYTGGFSRDDILEMLEIVDSNFLGWSRATAPAIMGNPDRPELGEALGNTFCRTDPAIARQFARVTFLSDNRSDLPRCTTATLVLQTRDDMIAPEEVGTYVAEHLPNATMVAMKASGHCPHMSAPAETIGAIRGFLDR